jgi:hypothetical protein
MGIKLCTAKYILALFRKKGKIYRKSGKSIVSEDSSDKYNEAPKTIYVPYPLFIFCLYSPQ